MTQPTEEGLPVRLFDSAASWERWLAENHAKKDGIWLRLFKKGSGRAAVLREEALDVALCYGWIDGKAKSCDRDSWLQKYTPRRVKSLWSKKNQERVARLIKEKRMKPAGLKAVAAAKADGRWEKAYDSPSRMDLPEDFLRALSKNARAEAFFKTLSRANTYAIAWRLQTAKKPETREKRMEALLMMMAEGKKLH
jgi:uncharacterized protein YdeI (YjbR/CyaY-like superfamily)